MGWRVAAEGLRHLPLLADLSRESDRGRYIWDGLAIVERAPSSCWMRPPAITPIVETLVLNPASILAVAVGYACLHVSDSSLATLLNPWGLSPAWWLGAYLAVRAALLGFVDGLVWVIGPRLPPLPSRTGPKPVFQHTIGSLDVTYLVINSTIEFVFTQQLAALLWYSPLVARTPAELGVLNVPVALWLLLGAASPAPRAITARGRRAALTQPSARPPWQSWTTCCTRRCTGSCTCPRCISTCTSTTTATHSLPGDTLTAPTR